MYTFVLVSIDRCPSVKDWKLLITPEENLITDTGITKKDSVLEQANDSSIQAYAQRYFEDKHMDLDSALKRSDTDTGKQTNVFFSMISHPLVLDGIKRKNMTESLRKGKTLLINRNGAYCFLEGHTILERVEKEDMIFPKEDAKKEHITISRYPGCKHYYLTSNLIGRIFAQNPFNDKERALEEALKYVEREQITVKVDTFAYTRQGD